MWVKPAALLFSAGLVLVFPDLLNHAPSLSVKSRLEDAQPGLLFDGQHVRDFLAEFEFRLAHGFVNRIQGVEHGFEAGGFDRVLREEGLELVKQGLASDAVFLPQLAHTLHFGEELSGLFFGQVQLLGQAPDAQGLEFAIRRGRGIVRAAGSGARVEKRLRRSDADGEQHEARENANTEIPKHRNTESRCFDA